MWFLDNILSLQRGDLRFPEKKEGGRGGGGAVGVGEGWGRGGVKGGGEGGGGGGGGGCPEVGVSATSLYMQTSLHIWRTS